MHTLRLQCVCACTRVSVHVRVTKTANNSRLNLTDLLSRGKKNKQKKTLSSNLGNDDYNRYVTTVCPGENAVHPLCATATILPLSSLGEGSRGSRGRSKHQSSALWPSWLQLCKASNSDHPGLVRKKKGHIYKYTLVSTSVT